MTTAARAAALASRFAARVIAAPARSALPVDLERRYGARNYDPLDVTLERG